MRRAIKILAAGHWNKAERLASVVLSFHDRYRRRLVLNDDQGAKFLLDLAKPVVLRDGDGLMLDNGQIIAVMAADEAVADIQGADARETARLAWHIGNRHTPLQILPDGTLRIHYDAVLSAMIKGLGATVVQRLAPFSPEPGAYAQNGEAAHSHHHDDRDHHDHHHDHAHPHPHDHHHE